jgi:TatD DNase family protein
MLIDTHCHLGSDRYPPAEIAAIIARAEAASVSQIVTLATCLEDIGRNLTAALHPAVHACVGIHPCEVHLAPDDACQQLAAFVADPRVAAIGETGLDYYHPAPEGWSEVDFRTRQRQFLRQHFALAAAAGLNIVIHTRDLTGEQSFADALAIYGDYRTSTRAVFHCFNGSYENAQRIHALGGLVSFGGVATFKTAAAIRATAHQCPAGSFMLETDAPYLAPVPHRGQRNEPAYLRFTAEQLAELRGETCDALAVHTTATAHGFFRFRG